MSGVGGDEWGRMGWVHCLIMSNFLNNFIEFIEFSKFGLNHPEL